MAAKRRLPLPSPMHPRLTGPVRWAVNGNPTTLDFGRLPWAIIVGANSSLELRDLIIHSYAPRSSASNTSHFYVGGLVSWPSISIYPSGIIKSCAALAQLSALRSSRRCIAVPSVARWHQTLLGHCEASTERWSVQRTALIYAHWQCWQCAQWQWPGPASVPPAACIQCSAAGTTQLSTSGAPRGTRATTASGALRLRCPERKTL